LPHFIGFFDELRHRLLHGLGKALERLSKLLGRDDILDRQRPMCV
jgi:hypothetical protein